jgi:hypothetical protein
LSSTIKRRIAGLERTWPRRRSLADVERDARNIVRLTGTTYESAFKGLLVDFSEDELRQILAEAELVLTFQRRRVREEPACVVRSDLTDDPGD